MRLASRLVSLFLLASSIVASVPHRARPVTPPDDDASSTENDPIAEDEAGADETAEDGVAVHREDESAPAVEADAGPQRRRRGGCPASMARVHDFCIDRYEAPNRRGTEPLVMQSAHDAEAWCSAHRKRLCSEDEWITACEGDEHREYPYGHSHVDGRCNDDKPWHKVDESTLAKWPAPEAQAHAKDLYQATPSGSKRQCASQDGVHDLTGNVEEWVIRTREHENPWPYVLAGCYWSGCYGGNKPTCHSTNNAHGPEFRFYETGFRCCESTSGAPAEDDRN